MNEVRIENWAVVRTDLGPYVAPEQPIVRLRGDVFGHPRIEDGKTILTSTIQGLDLDLRICITRNTTYTLGEPEAAYAEQYPQARSE